MGAASAPGDERLVRGPRARPSLVAGVYTSLVVFIGCVPGEEATRKRATSPRLRKAHGECTRRVTMARPTPVAFGEKYRRVQRAVAAARGADRRHFDFTGEVEPGVRLVLSEAGATPLAFSLWSYPQDIAELCSDASVPATAALLAIDAEQAREARAAGPHRRPHAVLAQPVAPRRLLHAVRPRELAPDPHGAAQARPGSGAGRGGRLTGPSSSFIGFRTVTQSSTCLPAARRPRPARAGARPPHASRPAIRAAPRPNGDRRTHC